MITLPTLVPKIARLTMKKEVQAKLKRPKKSNQQTPKLWDSDVSCNGSCRAGPVFKKIFQESSSLAWWSLQTTAEPRVVVAYVCLDCVVRLFCLHWSCSSLAGNYLCCRIHCVALQSWVLVYWEGNMVSASLWSLSTSPSGIKVTSECESTVKVGLNY